MKIAIINDTHCGCRNASDIFLNYHELFFRDVFFPYCKENNITQVIHLGDYYDNRKTISLKALNHNRKCFLEPLRENNMIMDIIPGNHDVVYKTTNELCSLKELLGTYLNNINLIMSPRVINYDGCDIAFLPWINSQNYDESLNFIQSCKSTILAAHLELDGFDVMKGMPSHGGMNPNMFSRFESVWSGHYHTKSDKDNIHYLGTQYELTWSDCNDNKYFHVFDTDTRQLLPVRNPHTLFVKYVYDGNNKRTAVSAKDVTNKFVKVIVTNKNDVYKFDKFIDNLLKHNPFDLKILENFDSLSGDSVKMDDTAIITDTADLINQYIDASETDLDKNILKERLRELYTEALNLEIA